MAVMGQGVVVLERLSVLVTLADIPAIVAGAEWCAGYMRESRTGCTRIKPWLHYLP